MELNLGKSGRETPPVLPAADPWYGTSVKYGFTGFVNRLGGQIYVPEKAPRSWLVMVNDRPEEQAFIANYLYYLFQSHPQVFPLLLSTLCRQPDSASESWRDSFHAMNTQSREPLIIVDTFAMLADGAVRNFWRSWLQETKRTFPKCAVIVLLPERYRRWLKDECVSKYEETRNIVGKPLGESLTCGYVEFLLQASVGIAYPCTEGFLQLLHKSAQGVPERMNAIVKEASELCRLSGREEYSETIVHAALENISTQESKSALFTQPEPQARVMPMADAKKMLDQLLTKEQLQAVIICAESREEFFGRFDELMDLQVFLSTLLEDGEVCENLVAVRKQARQTNLDILFKKMLAIRQQIWT